MGMICFVFVNSDFIFLLNWCHIVQYLHHYIMVSHFVYTQLAHVIMMVADALASNRQQAISNHCIDLTVATINVTRNMANFLYPPLQLVSHPLLVVLVSAVVALVVSAYCVAYCSHMTKQIMVSIGSGNDVLPDSTKPLPEPMLTWWGFLGTQLRPIWLEMLKISNHKMGVDTNTCEII